MDLLCAARCATLNEMRQESCFQGLRAGKRSQEPTAASQSSSFWTARPSDLALLSSSAPTPSRPPASGSGISLHGGSLTGLSGG